MRFRWIGASVLLMACSAQAASPSRVRAIINYDIAEECAHAMTRVQHGPADPSDSITTCILIDGRALDYLDRAWPWVPRLAAEQCLAAFGRGVGGDMALVYSAIAMCVSPSVENEALRNKAPGPGP